MGGLWVDSLAGARRISTSACSSEMERRNTETGKKRGNDRRKRCGDLEAIKKLAAAVLSGWFRGFEKRGKKRSVSHMIAIVILISVYVKVIKEEPCDFAVNKKCKKKINLYVTLSSSQDYLRFLRRVITSYLPVHLSPQSAILFYYFLPVWMSLCNHAQTPFMHKTHIP